MIIAQCAANESLRLAKLVGYNVLDTKPESDMDELTHLAANICETPIALVSLVDEDRQWFKSKYGLDASETPRDVAFCAHAILQDGVFEVPNTLEDRRFHDNPLVTGEPHIRFYAGAPLISPDGHAIGTLCVIDTKPKTLNDTQKRLLTILAKQVMAYLELQQQKRELNEASQLRELVSEVNQDLIFVKDQQFRIRYANPAFMALYPEDMQDKIIGHTTVEKYSPEFAESFLANDKQAFATGINKVQESATFPDGTQRTLDTRKQRFIGADGKHYILGVARDITQQVELIEALEASNKELDEFAYVAAHDLRAPVNAIQQLLSWVLEDCEQLLPAESADNLRLALGRSERLSRLLSDLLNYARINREQHPAQDIDLAQEVNIAAEQLGVSEQFHIQVNAAPLRAPLKPLQTVLIQLLGNAVKHHHLTHGNIHISGGEDEQNYFLRIEDDGPGIAPEHHERIFDLFQTLKPRDQVEGSGIGLSIIKRITEHYRGHVKVTSDGSNGSCFLVCWPKALQPRLQQSDLAMSKESS